MVVVVDVPVVGNVVGCAVGASVVGAAEGAAVGDDVHAPQCAGHNRLTPSKVQPPALRTVTRQNIGSGACSTHTGVGNDVGTAVGVADGAADGAAVG